MYWFITIFLKLKCTGVKLSLVLCEAVLCSECECKCTGELDLLPGEPRQFQKSGGCTFANKILSKGINTGPAQVSGGWIIDR